MGILAGKRILVTGVITDASIAFHVARVAQQEGASVVLTGFGRLSLVERIARRLPDPAPVLELDVTSEEQLDSLAERVSAHVDGLDGVAAGTCSGVGATAGTGLINPLVNTQFQYLDVGVNIDVTPRVHPEGDVSLKLIVDVSSVTGEVTTRKTRSTRPVFEIECSTPGGRKM